MTLLLGMFIAFVLMAGAGGLLGFTFCAKHNCATQTITMVSMKMRRVPFLDRTLTI